MPKRIDSLTQEQIDQMPGWVDKWVAIGLSTEPADWEMADRGVLGCYKAANLEPPKVILHMDSPFAAHQAGVRAVLHMNQDAVTEADIKEGLKASVYQRRGCSLWASWFAYITFLRDVCDWENESLEAFAYDEMLALSCGWSWWHADVCALSNRPLEIHRDEIGRLHNEDGPAMLYRDGWSIWSHHGTRVTERIIRGDFTAQEVIDETNAEIRRVMMEVFGFEALLRETNAQAISADEYGTLFRIDMDPEPLMLVHVINPIDKNGEEREYVLPVHPELRPMHIRDNGEVEFGEAQALTAHAAVASTYGMTAEEYKPDLRT